MKSTPVTKDQIKQIMNLYRKDMSGRAISKQVGIPHSAVHRIISANSLKITSRTSADKESRKSVSKSAKPVIRLSTVHTFTPFTPPPDAPICNATVISDPYRCPELSYRQQSRA